MVDKSLANSHTQFYLPVDSSVLYPRSNTRRIGGILNLAQSQLATINGKETFNVYNATTIPSTFLQGTSSLSIPIPPAALFLKHLRIEFTVANTGANPVTLLPVALWFASIQIASVSNVVLQQWNSPAEMFISQFVNISEEELTSSGPCINVNPSNPSTVAPGATLAAGATKKYYLTLPDAFWEKLPIWMGDINGNLILTLNSSANTAQDVTAGTGTIGTVFLSACRGLATVVTPASEQIQYMKTQTMRDNQFLQTTITTQTQALGAGQNYTINLSGNMGYCPYLFITTRGPLPFATSDSARNWPDIISSFSILDSAGNPIVITVDEQFASGILAADYWQGCQTLAQIGGVTQWSFSPAPGVVQKTGCVLGGIVLTAREQLKFTTEATMTPGTYEVSIIASMYAILRIKDGNIFTNNS
jgi:hypothetical protein